MKKYNIILVILLVLTVSLQAQDGGEKKNYFPEQGFIGIGVEGTPVFNYIGNFFNGTTNNRLNFNQHTLYFRYMLTDESAVRLRFSLFNDKATNLFYVPDDKEVALDPNSKKQLEDKQILIDREYTINAGYQYFIDYRRLRGFFGADVGYAYAKSREEYYYGNIMNSMNPTPSTSFSEGNVFPSGERNLEKTDGATNSIFIGAFTGAEYYFTPKICIGGELGINYGVSFYGQKWRKYETMAGEQRVEYNKAERPKSRYSFADSHFPYSYGNLYFMIHF